MPMHNAADTLRASIDSVLRQTYRDWELLIIDDSSSDSSPRIAGEFAEADPRIKTLINPGERGAAPTRNVGVAAATGRYIAFLDADDLWLAAKLARQVEHMQRTGAVLTYTWYVKVDGHARVDLDTFDPTQRIVRSPLHLTYPAMLKQDYIGFLTAMYDADAVGKHYFPPLKRRQDYAMLLNMMRAGIEAHGIAAPLAVYRAARRGSLSANKFKAARYNWTIYREHERLSLPRAIYSFTNYAIRAGMKYLI